jgi:predicted RNase H-like HicB family nuclease
MDLKVVVRPGEDGGYVAHVPALRGCWSQGKTREDALGNIREAIQAWLETEQDKADRAGKEGEVELLKL